MSRFAASAALAALALLLVAGSSPLAAADHAFSHRYIVYGKVVDANNNPVPNVTVEMGWDPKQTAFAPSEPCTVNQQPGTATGAFGPTFTQRTTNQHGEFIYCYHAHAISQALAGSYKLQIADVTHDINYTGDFAFDPLWRVDFPVIKLEKVIPTAVPENSTYTLVGRFFEPTGSIVYVEGNPVYGYTTNDAPVNITFKHDGKTETFSTTSNNYGDFSFRIPVAARPTSGSITVESHGVTMTKDVSPDVAVTGFKVDVPKPTDPFLRGALIVVGILVALGVVIGGGVYGYRRMSASREATQVRATAIRKRSR